MHRFMGLLLLAACAGPLHADVFKCVSANGEILFTNDRVEAKQRNCQQITVTPNVISAPPLPGKTAAPPPRPAEGRSPDFPKVAPQVQAQRDGDRKKILETELINEQKALQDARRELAEQENTRLGSERNAQRMLDRIEPYQKKVKLHEDNIANLQKELANLR